MGKYNKVQPNPPSVTPVPQQPVGFAPMQPPPQQIPPAMDSNQPTQQQPQQQAQGQNTNQPPAQQPTNPNSTQNTLLISEIRDQMVIMRDGSFRAVVACESINFDLMSSREREGVEYSYQNFLNSLYFDIQILIRSQRVDIGPYIDRLAKIRRNQDNMLLNVLMDDYIQFIDILSQEANIMDKSFYIVVPYYPTGDLKDMRDKASGFFGKLFAKQQSGPTKIDQANYEKAKDEIKNRVDSVMSGLFQMGVKSVQLNTRELGELYYNFYNPDTAVRQPLGNFEDMTHTFVQKGAGEAARPHLQEGGM